MNRMLFPIILSATLAQAQTAKGGAKALFYSSENGVATAPRVPKVPSPDGAAPTKQVSAKPAIEGVPPVTGLRYWVELQGTNGEMFRVNANRVFRTGDRIRLWMESNVEGTLTILQSQDGTPFKLLYAGGIDRYKEQVFPSETAWFKFDNSPGDLRIMVLVQSKETKGSPVDLALNAAKPGGPGVTAEEERQLAEHMRTQVAKSKGGAKGLMVEEDTSKDKAAVFFAAERDKKQPANAGSIAIELKLIHR